VRPPTHAHSCTHATIAPARTCTHTHTHTPPCPRFACTHSRTLEYLGHDRNAVLCRRALVDLAQPSQCSLWHRLLSVGKCCASRPATAAHAGPKAGPHVSSRVPALPSTMRETNGGSASIRDGAPRMNACMSKGGFKCNKRTARIVRARSRCTGAPAACKAIANGPVHRFAQDRQDACQKHTDVREQILYAQHAALCYIVVVVNVLSSEPDTESARHSAAPTATYGRMGGNLLELLGQGDLRGLWRRCRPWGSPPHRACTSYTLPLH